MQIKFDVIFDKPAVLKLFIAICAAPDVATAVAVPAVLDNIA